MFWIAVGAVAAALALIPVWRFLVKRLILAHKVKKLCRRKGFKLHKNGMFWLFGGKHGAACDFYIETRESVYSVKMFDMRRNTELVFHDDGSYHVRRLTAMLVMGGYVDLSADGEKKKFPRIDYRYHYRMDWEIKTPRPILLVHPVCREMRYIDGGKSRALTVGQSFGGAKVYSLSRFLSDLEVSV